MADTTPARAYGAPRQHRGWTGSFINNGRRLILWYFIVTIVFQCPASIGDVTDASSPICQPYLEARDQFLPYVKPYYDVYAAPSLEAIRPYAETFHSKVYQPAAGTATFYYEKYGAPRVTQARIYGEREWEKFVKPYADDLTAKAWAQYRIRLEPFVFRANKAIRPRLHWATDIAVRQYHTVVVPSYKRSLPYMQKALDQGQYYVVDVAYPYSRWAGQKTITFLTRKIWPTIRVLYGQNVEPQLSKIRERLSSYRDGKKLEAAIEALDSIREEPTPVPVPVPEPVAEQSIPPTPMPTTVTETSTPLSAETVVDTTGQPEPSQLPTPEKVTEDLKRWQAKFKRAADKGAEDLTARVAEIVSRQLHGQVRGTGDALITQLEEAMKEAVDEVKTAILKTVRDLPEEPTDEDKEFAIEGVRWPIRSAGKAVKERAQNIRSWKSRFDEDTASLIRAASSSTLNVMDGIRDLGLQEIGMRWASMDNVTYQDWTEYHNLKETFDEWREQVGLVAENHEDLAAAKREAEEVEENGMAIAEDAAKELARLKDVATWKIDARDSSDDFSTRQLPAAAARIAHKIMQKISEVTATTTSQGFVESIVSEASEKASSLRSTIGEAVAQASPTALDGVLDQVPSMEDLSGMGSAALSSVLDAATKASQSLSDIPSMAFESAASAVSTLQPVAESDTSAAAASVDSVTRQASDSAASIGERGSAYMDDASTSLHSAVQSQTPQIDSSVQSISTTAASALKAATEALADIIPSSLPTAEAAEHISTAASQAHSLGSSAGASIYSTPAPSVSGSFYSADAPDVMDAAGSASQSVLSLVNAAGEGYAEVTKTLAHAMRQSAVDPEHTVTYSE